VPRRTVTALPAILTDAVPPAPLPLRLGLSPARLLEPPAAPPGDLRARRTVSDTGDLDEPSLIRQVDRASPPAPAHPGAGVAAGVARTGPDPARS